VIKIKKLIFLTTKVIFSIIATLVLILFIYTAFFYKSNQIAQDLFININQEEKIYLLSEILYTINNTNEIDEKYELIKQSVLDIGFNNTANIYSISDSTKIGGKIGWVNKSKLSDKILHEIEKINVGEITKPIKIVSGYLILKLEEQKIEKKEINLNEKLKELINFETNKQLRQFSLLFFNKSKINQKIE